MMKTKKEKLTKVKQQALAIDEGLEGKVSGIVYRFRKIESLIAVSPFWKSAFLWFVLSFDIFLYIVLFFFLSEKIGDLPPRVPFLFYYPEGEAQLIDPNTLWYFYTGVAGLSFINLIFVGRLFQVHRYEAKYLLGAEFLKTVLFAVLIYKTFFNWII
jgi:hypothetical protein